MRSEEEMMALIMDFVAADPNIRAAVLIGSRANPRVKKDIFQDYDIGCFVENVDAYKTDRTFLEPFGERMLMQIPEDMDDPPPANDGHYGYLMQFTDGNRIDLGFAPVASLSEEPQGSLTKVLVDKDGILGDLPPPSDKDFLPKAPTEKSFDDCCNEFWWVCPYVAKALWREELIHAKSLLEKIIRPQLMKMVTWYFGIKTGFKKDPGKDAKYIKSDLEPELWLKLEDTYADSRFESTWESIFAMGDLFRTTSQYVANTYGFGYSDQADRRVTEHLRHVRQLPKDAKAIYP